MITRTNCGRYRATMPIMDCRWNNADRNWSMQPSMSDLYITKQVDAYVSIRATLPRRSGRHCFEIKTVSLTTSYAWWIKVGIVPKSTSMDNYIGVAANDIVFDGNGAFLGVASVHPAYGNANGNQVGFGFDFSKKTAEFFLNGVRYGEKDISSKLLDVPYYPALMLYGAGNQALVNFGETPFVNPMHDYLEWNRA